MPFRSQRRRSGHSHDHGTSKTSLGGLWKNLGSSKCKETKLQSTPLHRYTSSPSSPIVYSCIALPTVEVQTLPDPVGALTPHIRTRSPVCSGKPRPLAVYLDDVKLPAEIAVSRDERYYADHGHGGQCIFLVEDVLFKIDTCLLTRDGSTFHHMFSLPQTSSATFTEGLTDDNPIILYHDTPDQFRALLWVLNAHPLELQLHDVGSLPSIEWLINLVEITHKYQFERYEAWAGIALRHSLSRIPFVDIPSALLSRVLSLCFQVEHVSDTYGDLLISYLQDRILSDHQFAVLPDLTSTAEHHGLTDLVVAIKYRRLVEEEHRFTESNKHRDASRQSRTSSGSQLQEYHDASADPNTGLSCFTGQPASGCLADSPRCSLYFLWRCLLLAPPTFESNCGPVGIRRIANPLGSTSSLSPLQCTHGCDLEWRRIWIEAYHAPDVRRCAAVDVLGRLWEMRKVLGGLCAAAMGVSCALAALEALEKLIGEVKRNLVVYFKE